MTKIQETTFPLSFAQQRLWILDQVSPLSNAYNIPIALKIKGDLDIYSLERAYLDLLNRHESLRTSFKLLDDQPVQVINDVMANGLAFYNLSDKPINEAENYLQELLIEQKNKTFCLSEPPLIEGKLVKLKDKEFYLLITIHHIIADGWSIGIFNRELIELYNSYYKEGAANLPEVELQYADFSLWQREWFANGVLDKQLAYWGDKLANIPEVLQLPIDKLRPKEASYKGKAYQYKISKHLLDKLQAIANTQGITLFTALLAVFKILLHRYTGQDDIIVGIPVANRHYPGVENIIGFFVNSLALRFDFTSEQSFIEVLNRLNELTLEAYDHQDVPFEQVVDYLGIERSLSHNPIFQTWFLFEEQQSNENGFADLDVVGLLPEENNSKFDLTLRIISSSDEATLRFTYATDLFEEATVAQIAKHFEVLLMSLLDNPEKSIKAIDFLTEKEKQLQLEDFIGGEEVSLSEQGIHQLFESAVKTQPNKIALQYQGNKITYAELNKKINQLANYLETHGVSQNDFVAISLERSFDLVISLFAVLKVGAVYIPLDPNYPKERLVHMLSDSKPKAIISTSLLMKNFDYSGVVICLDTISTELENESDCYVSAEVNENSLAYIIYTSGSTGLPKGVMCYHKGVVNRILWAPKMLHFNNSEVCLLQANFSFVDAVWEIFGPLALGATLIIPPDEVSKDADKLVACLTEHKITRFGIVPSFLKILLTEYPNLKDLLPDLSHCEVSGESLNSNLAKQFKKILPDIRIYNRYGATEATSIIYDPIHLWQENSDKQNVRQLVLANTQIYILDEALQLVPFGAVGELYVSGVGLAKGYLNLDDMTQEKFINHPFIAGEKIYKTGDLGRFLPNGRLEILGRRDHQVKIRGFRVELSEIENCLNKHENIKDSLVVVHTTESSHQILVAYVILNDTSNKGVEDFRFYCIEHLPDYMQPTAFIALDQFPLTPNGKLDRAALPLPSLSIENTSEVIIKPRSSTEEKIWSIWSEVLGLEEFSITSNFFELGGDSLLATQVITRMRRAFEYDISLKLIFIYPTVESFSKYLDDSNLIKQNPVATITKLSPSNVVIPASFSQQRLWFLEQYNPQTSLYNIPMLLEFKGELNINALQKALNSLMARHESLRTQIHMQDDELYQVVIDETNFPLIIKEEGNKDLAMNYLHAIANKPFVLDKDLLVQGCLLKQADNQFYFLVVMHHIITDGWSSVIFCRELASYYNAYCQNQELDIKPLLISYADYASWQKEQLNNGKSQEQLDFWVDYLYGAPQELTLPTDNPRPTKQEFSGGNYQCKINAALIKKLTHLAVGVDATLFMVLITALYVLLKRYSRQDDIVIGSPIANRHHANTENIIGFFVNTLAIRINTDEENSFINLLKAVREDVLSAYENQDVPFDKIVDELEVERDPSRHPLFQVLFALQNVGKFDFSYKDLLVEPVSLGIPSAKFDLSFRVNESDSDYTLVVDYASSIFSSNTIEQMVLHYINLLNELVSSPEKKIKDYQFLTQEECQQQLFLVNENDTDYPNEETVVDLFEQQVEKFPNQVALVSDAGELTYSELNNKANQLAKKLVEQYQVISGKQFSIGTLVPIFMQRSQEMIVAMLAILKAGGAYVPVDVNSPVERIKFILNDVSAKVVLTHSATESQWLEQYPNLSIINIDSYNFSSETVSNLAEKIENNELAYVLYTSGTTGKPKGVMVEHLPIVSLVKANGSVNIDSSDVFLQFASPVFDAATFEIWGALLNGAKLVLPAPQLDVLANANQFKKILSDYGVTILWLTKTLFDHLYQLDPNLFSTINYLLVGGEALNPELISKLCHQTKRPSYVINGYGPTEGTTFSTFYLCETKEYRNVPIGKPLANRRAYILDDNLLPVPKGSIGELYLGGSGLARGYLNQPKLTKERFINNPYASLSDQQHGYSRLYKTGDLVRYLADGNIEYVGRNDQQIKLRGFRIELSEIESVIKAYKGIYQVAVVLKEKEGNKFLVAYYVAERKIKEDKLVRYLADNLPEYMLPSIIIHMTSFPITMNGKLNYAALPDPDFTATSDYTPPQNFLEEQLVKLWSDLLGLDETQLSVKANFFKLGGNSLLATRLIARIDRELGCVLALRELFEKPTISHLAEVIENSKSNISNTIEIVSRPEHLPLSFSQQRLWFLEQLMPNTGLYNIPLVISVNGLVDKTALTKAFQSLVDRHEILRTVIVEKNGEPEQVILADSHFDLTWVDLSNFDKNEKTTKVQQLIDQNLQHGFDLQAGPLLRATLVKLDTYENILIFVLHHMVADGWSVGIINRELSHYYKMQTQQLSKELPSLTLQYADFSLWQRNCLEGEKLHQEVSYWKEKLANIPKLLQLPTTYERPKDRNYQGQIHVCELDSELIKRIREFSGVTESSLFMIFLAVFQVLLHRYSGQEEIVIGSLIANRRQPEWENLIGFFVNMLAFKGDCANNPSFTNFLKQVKNTVLEGYEHQDLPFDLLVEKLKIDRDLSYHPIFQVMLVFQNASDEQFSFSDFDCRPYPLVAQTAKFDLTLRVVEKVDKLFLAFEYATDLFSEDFIKRFSAHFVNLIDQFSTDSDQYINNVPMLLPKEKEKIIYDWNRTENKTIPYDTSFVDLFEQQVARVPNKRAVVCDDNSLTYQQLNQKANVLAQYFYEKGVRQGDLVVVFAQRDIEFLSGMIAIMKLGAIYTPLDPAYPLERTINTLKQSKAKFILTNTKNRNLLLQSVKGIADFSLLEFSEVEEVTETLPNFKLDYSVTDVAYIIYTSGSTGTPKGAMVEHRGMVNHLYAKILDLNLTEVDRIAQNASQSFDISVWQFYVGLIIGATVYIYPDKVAHDPMKLLTHVKSDQLTILEVVPSLLRVMLEEINSKRQSSDYRLEKLRWLVPTGEALPVELAREWLSYYPKIPLMNAYGPTECSDDVTHFAVTHSPSEKMLSIPIGKPISNMKAYILNASLIPVPVGVAGELCIAGVGVGQGYLDDLEKTQSVFLESPFVAGERLYRTGDLARYLENGDIEFLGRIDHQVKINGYRIELGEIETVLAKHELVYQVVVTAKENYQKQNQLIAYLVVNKATYADDAATTLRNYLASRLPVYMVPAHFIVLDAMPLTSNDKIDRKALPEINLSEKMVLQEYVAPQSKLEVLLAEIWQELLVIENVGRYDNFFQLGGDSITSIRLVSKSRQHGIAFSIKDVFEHQTIAELAKFIDEGIVVDENEVIADLDNNTIDIEKVRLSLDKAEITSAYPLSPLQQGFLFNSLYQEEANTYWSQIAFEINGELSEKLFQLAWQIVIGKHEILRTGFAWEDTTQVLQYVEDKVNLPWQLHYWEHLDSRTSEQNLAALIVAENKRKVDLQKPPLMRFNLIQLAGNSFYFLWGFHHILLDGWSTSLVIRDIWQVYQQLASGQSLALPTVRPYKDYIAWTKQKDETSAKAFWGSYLANLDEPIYLSQKNWFKKKSIVNQRYQLNLSEKFTSELKEFAKQQSITLNTLIQSAWILALSKYLQNTDVVFGVTVSGRSAELEAIETMVGLFINTLPMYISLRDDTSLKELFSTVQKNTFELNDYSYVPLSKIQSWSGRLTEHPLFDCLYVFENFPYDESSLNDNKNLKVKSILGDLQSEYPLSFIVLPGEQLAFRFSYNPDLLSGSFVQQFAMHLEYFLQQFLVIATESYLGDISFLTKNEEKKLLAWNHTSGATPAIDSLSSLIEDKANKFSDIPAVVDENITLSYQELNEKANRLARYLQTKGIMPKNLIGLSMNRSVDMIVAILAILKIKCAYVPLDPTNPIERLKFILEDTNAQILLTDTENKEKLNFFSGELLCYESFTDELEHYESSNLNIAVQSDDLAYVIYTSGTTGKPKGVMIEHSSVINLAYANQQPLGIYVKTRLLQFASLNFDASVWEIFPALCNGASLYIISEASRRDGNALIQYLRDNKIQVATLPPPLLAALPYEPLPDLATLVIAGDVCDYQTMSLWSQGRNFINAYGPTEGTVCATLSHFSEEISHTNIGKPLANMQVYVLDKQTKPMPIGVPGELYIGGAGVARGYLNQPELTAERFIPDEFSNIPNARLYKTGDKVKYCEDGSLEFLGRVDDQVKLRGYRIELQEIEQTIKSHAMVTDAKILVREITENNKALVAYVISEENQGIKELLQTYVEEHLPQYMIPKYWVFIDQFYLTPSGKVNTALLPMPEQSQEEKFIAPITELEKQMVVIWQKVIGQDSIGVEDNFFQLGGDSILTIQLVAAARQIGIYFNVKQVFDYPTIKELLGVAEFKKEMSYQIDQSLAVGSVLLTPIQKWFFEQEFSELEHFNQAIMLKPKEIITFSQLKSAVELLCEHHDSLRLKFFTIDGVWQQEYVLPERLLLSKACEYISLESVTSEKRLIEMSAHIEQLQKSFNLSEAPLFKVALFDLGEELGQRIVWIAHHLLVDGVSWRILIEDLTAACQSIVSREGLILPLKTTSYKDFALALNEYANSDELLVDESYWQELLSYDVNPLPYDYDSIENDLTWHIVSSQLNKEETAALLKNIPHAYNTEINDVLLTALSRSFYGWTKERRLWITMEGHGRETINPAIDLSRTVGWFTAIYPVLLDLGEHDDIAYSLKSVKEQLRKIPKNRLSYSLIHYLKNDCSISLKQTKSPIEVCFNYLGQWDQQASGNSLFTYANESTGQGISAKNVMSHLIEVNCKIINGCLKVSWSYRGSHFKKETVSYVAEKFISELKEIITHCRADNFGYTPSDFPLVDLTQVQLDQHLLNKGRVNDLYPLAPMQKGFLFQAMSRPESDNYLIQNVFRLSGNVEIETLSKAWEMVISHHPILRTGFIWQGSKEFMQFVQASLNLSIEVLNWEEFDLAASESNLEMLLIEDRAKPFNLNKPPLFRLKLIKLCDEQFYLIWTHYHILLDGWCMPIIFGDFIKSYQGLVKGEPIILEKRSAYRDYIGWIKQQNEDKAKEFWINYLESHKAMPNWQRVSNTVSQSPEQKAFIHEVPLSLNEALVTWAHKHQCTLNTVFLASLALVLRQYMQQDDITLGVTVSGRSINLVGVENMVGLMANTVPLTINCSSEKNIVSLIKRIQTMILDINDNAYVSLADIQGYLKQNNEGNLFNTIFVFENYPVTESSLKDDSIIDIQALPLNEKTEFPLAIAAIPGKQIKLKFYYSTEYFNSELLADFSSKVEAILYGVVNDSCLSELQKKISNKLTNDAYAELVYQANEIDYGLAKNKTIHEVFEEQVKATPNAIALVCGDQQLTYKELNEKSNKLARYLRKKYFSVTNKLLSAETLIPICVKRNLDMVIGIYAVLKAGAAYIPIDPEYPDDRINFILQDSHSVILLTQSDFNDRFQKKSLNLVNLLLDKEDYSNEDSNNLDELTKSNNLAYVIYTSGTTGKPKGVMIEHEGVVNMASDIKYCDISSSSVMASVSNYTFDSSVFDFFVSLLNGARLVVLEKLDMLSEEKFSKAISKYKLNTALIPTALFNLLADYKDKNVLKNFKTLFFGGEKANLNKVLALAKSLPQVTLINLYGPTETVVYATYYQIKGSESKLIPIGTRAKNKKLYVLDSNLNPCSVGEKGELYIGGVGVARGYLNQAELTEKFFIENPYATKADYEHDYTRLYKTGDIVRLLEDGNIDYVGRDDFQVKLRGFRIELNEIEEAINHFSKIKQSIVLVKEKQNNKFLVAYYVSEDDCCEEELYKYLESCLPEYMIPSFFVALPKMPLTLNGKVDRAALPDPKFNMKVNYLAPRNDLEALLCHIWAEVLDLESELIGVRDNFFTLGGTSITAVQVNNKAAESGVFFDLDKFFQNPVIEQLLPFVRTQSGESNPLLPIQTSGLKQPLFLIHPIGGQAYPYLGLAEYIKDIPIYGLSNPHYGKQSTGFSNIEEMASYYLQTITRVQQHGPYRVGGWSFGGIVAFEIAKQLEQRGEIVETVLLIDTPHIKAYQQENYHINKETYGLADFDLAKQEIIANAELFLKYVPKDYSGNLTLIKAETLSEEFSQFLSESQWEDYGWNNSEFNIDKLIVSGSHYELFSEPYIENLSRNIYVKLNKNEEFVYEKN